MPELGSADSSGGQDWTRTRMRRIKRPGQRQAVVEVAHVAIAHRMFEATAAERNLAQARASCRDLPARRGCLAPLESCQASVVRKAPSLNPKPGVAGWKHDELFRQLGWVSLNMILICGTLIPSESQSKPSTSKQCACLPESGFQKRGFLFLKNPNRIGLAHKSPNS